MLKRLKYILYEIKTIFPSFQFVLDLEKLDCKTVKRYRFYGKIFGFRRRAYSPNVEVWIKPKKYKRAKQLHYSNFYPEFYCADDVYYVYPNKEKKNESI